MSNQVFSRLQRPSLILKAALWSFLVLLFLIQQITFAYSHNAFSTFDTSPGTTRFISKVR